MKKSRKKIKSKYKKNITVAFLLYAVYGFLCFLAALIAMSAASYANADAVGAVAFGISFVLFMGGSAAMIFLIIPAIKRVQAREDFSKHDFTPYKSVGEHEIYKCVYLVARYTLTVSPFDENESVVLYGDEGLENYFSQFSPDRLIVEEQVVNDVNNSPFFIHYYFKRLQNECCGVKSRVDRTLCGDSETVDLYDIHRAEFTKDGVTVGNKLYPYGEVEAEVVTGFGKNTDYYVSLRMILTLADDGFLSFSVSPRIAAICERFGIKVNAPDMLAYILADPERAFEQTALQLGLRKLK